MTDQTGRLAMLLVGWLFTGLLATQATIPSELRAPTAPQREAHLEHLSEWGCDSCDGAERLSEVVALAVTDEGSVLVVDRYEPFIRVWSRANELLAWFGREGEGPGELIRPGMLSDHGAGMLSVVDARLRRWTTFDLTGKVVATRRIGKFPTGGVYSVARGALLQVTTAGSCGVPDVRETRLDDGVTSIVSELDDIPLDPRGCAMGVYSFDASPAGGFAVGFGRPDYLIREYDSNGVLVREIRRDVARVPKTDDELAEDAGLASRLGLNREVDPLRFHFFGNALRYDSVGRLWVRTARGTGEQTVLDVFENGELLDEVVVPLAVGSKAASFDVSGDFLGLVSNDDLGNPTVSLFGVVWR